MSGMEVLREKRIAQMVTAGHYRLKSMCSVGLEL